MSFSEDCVRFGDQLAKCVDAGVEVREAAGRLGISHQRCYAILRATGRPVGSARVARRSVDSAAVMAIFDATGSVNAAAAKANTISHGSARRVLVDKGLISKDRQPYGEEGHGPVPGIGRIGLVGSAGAREVGVNERTRRDWRDGIRKIGYMRI